MSDLILKGVSAILFVAVVFLSGMRWVDLRTIDDLSARNEGLSAALKAVDLKAKSDEKNYKENLHVIQDKSNRDRAAVADYYRRMLPKTGDNFSASNPAKDTTAMDATSAEPRLTGCSLEIESRCVRDAQRVEEVAEFFRVNKFPLLESPDP